MTEFSSQIGDGVRDILRDVMGLERNVSHRLAPRLFQVSVHAAEMPLEVNLRLFPFVRPEPRHQSRLKVAGFLDNIQAIIDHHFIRPR